MLWSGNRTKNLELFTKRKREKKTKQWLFQFVHIFVIWVVCLPSAPILQVRDSFLTEWPCQDGPIRRPLHLICRPCVDRCRLLRLIQAGLDSMLHPTQYLGKKSSSEDTEQSEIFHYKSGNEREREQTRLGDKGWSVHLPRSCSSL